MAHQTTGNMASVTRLSPEPPDLAPSSVQPAGVDKPKKKTTKKKATKVVESPVVNENPRRRVRFSG